MMPDGENERRDVKICRRVNFSIKNRDVYLLHGKHLLVFYKLNRMGYWTRVSLAKSQHIICDRPFIQIYISRCAHGVFVGFFFFNSTSMSHIEGT